MSFSFRDRKSERKLASIWNILLNRKNYSIPQNLEENRDFELFSPKLTIGSSEWFLGDRIKAEFKSFIDIIYSIPDIESTVAYKTVHDSVKNELEIEISSKSQVKSLRSFSDVLEAIWNRISEKRKSFDFYFALEGLELKGLNKIEFGSIEVILFDEALKEYMRLNSNNLKNQVSDKRFSKFVDKELLGRVCIKCSSFGDLEKAQEVARIKAREIINLFRYILGIFTEERIHENLVKINILSEAFTSVDRVLAREQESDSVIFTSCIGRKNLEKFPVNEERIRELRENLFLDKIIRIFNSSERTKVEGCIVTAIYWAGEAQNEFDRDVAFLKYWTALECIFSYKKDEISKSLAKGVSRINALWDYKVIQISEIHEVSKKVERLYDVRSRIIHRGLTRTVNELQLVEICKYTSWTILNLLDLHSRGYTTLEQIDRDTTSLYNNLK
jgi:hypothetical protein